MMTDKFALYINRAISTVLLVGSLAYISFLFYSGINNQAEQLNNYGKVMSVFLGIYAGLYCLDSIKGKLFQKQNSITALITIAIVLFGDINFEQNVFSLHGYFDFFRLFIGNALILVTLYLFYSKKYLKSV
ncbi:hypothetical protein [Acetobacter orientalis]|nr:hypothetical protein [Acetobacter orientalis]